MGKEQLLELYAEGRPCIVSDMLTEQELRDGRLVVMNYWRPTCTYPLRRSLLAILDPTSCKKEDLLEYAHDPNPRPQHYTMPFPVNLTIHKDSKDHKWFYPSEMTRDEILCFKNYDSADLQPSNGV